MIVSYLSALKKALDALNEDGIEAASEALWKAHEDGKTIFVCGNGGSAATASHMVNDFSKLTITEGKSRVKAISLTDNTPLLTAWSNDSKYEDCFVEQLKNFFVPGDVVVAISSSGNSPNVLRTVEYANQNGGVTVGLSGFQGGKLSQLARLNVIVPSNSVQIVEDIHMILSHLMCLMLVSKIRKGK
jgi:D-sedoheptulose 7-phosphate isomerase